jgi:hypothetical protein
MTAVGTWTVVSLEEELTKAFRETEPDSLTFKTGLLWAAALWAFISQGSANARPSPKAAFKVNIIKLRKLRVNIF